MVWQLSHQIWCRTTLYGKVTVRLCTGSGVNEPCVIHHVYIGLLVARVVVLSGYLEDGLGLVFGLDFKDIQSVKIY